MLNGQCHEGDACAVTLKKIEITGKFFFKSVDERNHRFIPYYIIAIRAEISQKVNCFLEAGSIVYSC